MNSKQSLEKHFKNYLKNLDKISPEAVIHVDLELLQRLNLLNFYHKDFTDGSLTRYFQVIETPDKITLVNDEFAIWIVPDKLKEKSITYTIVALNKNKPHLELVFIASGIYNNSNLVLKVLEKFLFEIQENEASLKNLA